MKFLIWFMTTLISMLVSWNLAEGHAKVHAPLLVMQISLVLLLFWWVRKVWINKNS